MEADLAVDADAAALIDAVNVNAEMTLGDSFIVDARLSVAETIALCMHTTPRHISDTSERFMQSDLCKLHVTKQYNLVLLAQGR